MDIQNDDIKRKRFLWGVCLAWTPFLFFIPTVIGAFNGIAREKATGFAAVAGGLAEFFSTFGLVATLVFEAAAIILLLRTFSGPRPLRALFSVISICCSVFVLMIVTLFCLSLFVLRSHH
jgi:hypothetical protein